MSRFVILFHELPPSQGRPAHWDLMLESGDVLRTWALDREPCLADEIGAEELIDHRVAYLDYEGPISGGRGSVSRWDAGEYRVESESEDALRLTLSGRRLCGALVLRRVAPASHSWRASFTAEPRSG